MRAYAPIVNGWRTEAPRDRYLGGTPSPRRRPGNASRARQGMTGSISRFASNRPLAGSANTKRSSVAADECKTAAEVHQRKDRGLSAVRGDRLHGDVERFPQRLVAIIEPQPRSDLGWAQLETNPFRAGIDLGLRGGFGVQAELRDRDDRELHFERHRRISKRRPAEDLVGRHPDLDPRGVERVTIGVDSGGGAERYGSPDPDPGRSVIGRRRLRAMPRRGMDDGLGRGYGRCHPQQEHREQAPRAATFSQPVRHRPLRAAPASANSCTAPQAG
jgi:hypothetical protein